MTVELSNMSKKKRTIDCNKSEVMCDIGIVQYDNETIECEKKIREPPKVTKVQSHVILVLHNLIMVLSNVRKKILVQLNVAKVWSNVMLVLPNVTMELSNVTKI